MITYDQAMVFLWHLLSSDACRSMMSWQIGTLHKPRMETTTSLVGSRLTILNENRKPMVKFFRDLADAIERG